MMLPLNSSIPCNRPPVNSESPFRYNVDSLPGPSLSGAPLPFCAESFSVRPHLWPPHQRCSLVVGPQRTAPSGMSKMCDVSVSTEVTADTCCSSDRTSTHSSLTNRSSPTQRQLPQPQRKQQQQQVNPPRAFLHTAVGAASKVSEQHKLKDTNRALPCYQDPAIAAVWGPGCLPLAPFPTQSMGASSSSALEDLGSAAVSTVSSGSDDFTGYRATADEDVSRDSSTGSDSYSPCRESGFRCGAGSGDRTQRPSAATSAASTTVAVTAPALVLPPHVHGVGAATASSAAPSLFSTNPFTLRCISNNSSVTDADGVLGVLSTQPPLMLKAPEHAVKTPLPHFFQRASRMVHQLINGLDATTTTATSADDLGLHDFFVAFFIDEEWFTKESLVHSLCLINRLTKVHPTWWKPDEGTEEGAAASPVVVMPSERTEEELVGGHYSTEDECMAAAQRASNTGREQKKESSSTAAASVSSNFFTRASTPRALLALLLLSSKFVDDITYNTESICEVMAKLRERQRRERELEQQRHTQQQHLPQQEFDERMDSPQRQSSGTGAAVSRRKGGLYSTQSMTSLASSCASLCSLGAASTTSSTLSMYCGSSVAVYPVLKPARLGQCEQRMFKSLDHSVWVKVSEYNACRAAMDVME